MILKNCRLIPELTDGIDFTLADITIDQDKISHITPANGTPAEAGDIDCKGMTVIPGMFDLHVHLVDDEVANDVYHAFELYHRYAPKLGTFLDFGVTTIRDCGSTMMLGCYMRDSVNNGLIEGPHILSSGHIISPEAMRNDGDRGIHTIANGVDEVTKAARREFANGADFIKIYASQSMAQGRSGQPKCIFTDEEIAAMVAVAKQNNSYVAAHAHCTDAINACLRNGVRSIEHASHLDDESIRLLTTLPDAYIVPTSAVAEPYAEGDGYNDPRIREFWNSPGIKASGMRTREWRIKAYKAGVKFGLGTDLGIDNFVKHPYEFRIKKESQNMDNLDILIQATRGSAEIAMVDHFTGIIKEGYCADLVGVYGNPDDDISIMYKKPPLVIKSGSVKKNQIQK